MKLCTKKIRTLQDAMKLQTHFLQLSLTAFASVHYASQLSHCTKNAHLKQF